MKHGFLTAFAAALLAACQTTSSGPATTAQPASRPDTSDFGPWLVAERSIKGNAYARNVPADPTGRQAVVERFSVSPGQCVGQDCRNNSSRYERQENIYDYPRHGSRRQPREAWYGWDVMLADGSAWGTDQAVGPIILGQFKQTGVNCPIFLFKHQAGFNDPAIEMALPRGTGLPEGAGDCVEPVSAQVGDVREIIGSWGRIELFVRWAPDASGSFDGYLNGRKVLEHRGPTCVERCENIYFKYGVYYANQRTRPAQPVTAFFRNVSRSLERVGLAGAGEP